MTSTSLGILRRRRRESKLLVDYHAGRNSAAALRQFECSVRFVMRQSFLPSQILISSMAQKRPKKPSRLNSRPEPKPEKRLKVTEELLMSVVSELGGSRIVMTSGGAAQAAAEVATRNPQSKVECYFLDVFLADAARLRTSEIPNLEIRCEADFAPGPTDCVALTLASGSESELARDFIQTGHQLLGPDGRLIVTTDNPHDHWVHEHLKDLFEKVTNRGEKTGRIYICSKPKELKKIKCFDGWFAFRDNERLIHAVSRPGVFSHRRLDLGARALTESLTTPDGPHAGEAIKDGMRVVDVGCGTGVVGFASAMRAEGVHVLAMDSNARALQCTQRGAEKNGLTCIQTQLEAASRVLEPETYDLVLANPPYFSNFKIAEIFVQTALNGLKIGGRTHFVTKQPEWFVHAFTHNFVDVSVREIRGYFIVKATQTEPMQFRSSEGAPGRDSKKKRNRDRGEQRSDRRQ